MPKNSNNPTCAVILIGNEILSGRTADANLNFIARRMSAIGIRLEEARIIPDKKRVIADTVNELRTKYTYIFTTGGIGPTHDDITATSIAKAFNVKLERDKSTEKLLQDTYLKRHMEENEVPAASLKMADFPQGATLIKNPVSTAPGFAMGNVFVFAGIPRVMQAMLEAVIPLLEKGDKIYSKSIDTYISEGAISAEFENIQNDFPLVELGSYPFKTSGRFGTSLVGRSSDKEMLDKAFTKVKNLLKNVDAEVR